LFDSDGSTVLGTKENQVRHNANLCGTFEEFSCENSIPGPHWDEVE
jgi:hypothetical protein